MNYGYARVSDKSQNIQYQVEELERMGCDRIVQEVVSGVSKEKEKLDELIESIQEGDTLTVIRVDRLGRNTLQLLTLIEFLEEKGVNLVIKELGMDTNTPVGKAVISFLSAIAQMERENLKIKQKKGIESARARGVHLGRVPKYTKKSFEKAVKDYLNGATVADVSTTYNIPRSTFYKFLKDEGISRTF